MKAGKKFMLVLAIAPLLCSCDLFSSDEETSSSEGGAPISNTSTSEQAYQYSAKDILYYKSAGEEICWTSSGSTKRYYYKAYDGYCAVAIANIGDYFGPVLVGEDQAQVCYKVDKNTKIVQSAGSVVVDGKTYYYSNAEYFLSGKLDGKTKYNNYFSKYTTLEEVARDVASKATFVPVSESVKKVYEYFDRDDGTIGIKAGPYFSTIEKAIIPAQIDGKTVSTIYDNAFDGFNNLKEVILPSGIVRIGKYAFANCSKLNRAYVPSSVTSAGYGVFSKNASDMIVFCGQTSRPNGYNTDWLDDSCGYAWGVKNYGENDNFIYAEYFDGTLLLSKYKGNEEDVIIPETIDGKEFSYVGCGSFKNNQTMKTISFPNSILTIGQNAFKGCLNLDNVVIPFGVTSIGQYAFSECPKLHRAYVPSSVTSAGYGVFYQNTSDLYVFCGQTSRPNGYNSDWAYGANMVCWGVKNYSENSEFLYSELIDGTLHLSLYKGDSETVEIPSQIDGKTVTVIGGNSFANKENLRTVIIPSTIKEIRHHAFNHCLVIEEINIPYGVESIAEYAFSDCPKLHRAYIPSSVTYAGFGIFYGNASDLYVFCGQISKPSRFNSDWAYSAKRVFWSASGYLDHGDNLYKIPLYRTALSLVAYKKNADGVVQLPEDGIIRHNDVDYPITNIASKALAGDTLVYSINLPPTLQFIEDYAFDGCINLAFVFDFSKTNVIYIGDYAFRNTKLNEMRIPRSMQYIGAAAFSGTTFNAIHYGGTIADWNSIGKSDGGLLDFILNLGWRNGSSIDRVYCTDGTKYF